MNYSNNEKTSNNRFWEFYLVRYFVGTMVGAGLVFYLNSNFDSKLWNEILPGLSCDFSTISSQSLILLGALGLTYCYIASAPILVLHATRAFWFHENTKGLNLATAIACILFIFSFAWAYIHNSIDNGFYFSVLGFLLSVQVLWLGFAYYKQGEVLHNYYNKLVISRSRKTLGASEYIESYRHLREHGNAFLIIIFEVVLAIIILTAPSKTLALLAVFLWVLPAGFVWLLGSVLENRFSKGT